MSKNIKRIVAEHNDLAASLDELAPPPVASGLTEAHPTVVSKQVLEDIRP